MHLVLFFNFLFENIIYYCIIMTLYLENDLNILTQKSDDIKNQFKKLQLEKAEPNVENVYKAHNMVLKYCKEKKRKLYGGYALHLLLSSKDKTKALYDKDKIPPPDIDVYTPEPIEDMYNICNNLHNEGFKYIRGEEALHGETYKIFYYKINLCDFSYVPKNVYNRMPFKEIQGLNCIHPNFMTIDYLRMLTNPISSYWRFFEEANLKAFRRFISLQSEYPLPTIKEQFTNKNIKPIEKLKVYEIIYRFLLNRTSTITIGFYAYNQFCMSIKKEPIEIPFYDFISINYKDDVRELLNLLKKEVNDIDYKEFYPFFQFTDYSTQIYYKNELVCNIYNHLKRCIPYQDLKSYNFHISNPVKTNDTIRVGTFTLCLLYVLINTQKARVNENDEMEKYYYHMSSSLIQIKNNYFAKNEQNFLDDTIFKDFILDCIGEEMTMDELFRAKLEKRKEKKMPSVLRYVPAESYKEGPKSKFIFLNSSGNEINNPNNLKIYKKKDKKN
jgi:Mimiviridae putative poly(A) polymerase catalytic subunit